MNQLINPQIQSKSSDTLFLIRIVTRKQLAEILQLSPSFISKLMSEKGLPYFKIGRAVRFQLKEVMRFLEERKMP